MGTQALLTGNTQNRLLIKDEISNTKFFVDSGAETSILPRKFAVSEKSGSNFNLYAANHTAIPTYEVRRLKLDLGLGRPMYHNF